LGNKRLGKMKIPGRERGLVESYDRPEERRGGGGKNEGDAVGGNFPYEREVHRRPNSEGESGGGLGVRNPYRHR